MTRAALADWKERADRLASDSIAASEAVQALTATGQDANGNLYYILNGSKANTNPYLRLRAEEMGYNRLHGSDLRLPSQDHAEQQMMNALEERRKAVEEGYGDDEPYRSLPVEPVRLSPSKQPCDDNPNNSKPQGCRERSGDRLVGW